MSTTQNPSLQVYAPNGTPIPRAVSCEHLLDLARGAYERAGTHLDRGDVDIELAEVADKAACSLLRDRWNDDFPIAAYVELLTAVAALRAVFGFDPTPTAREVTDWSEELGKRLGCEIDGPVSLSFIRFENGPYQGAVLRIPGALALNRGPAATLTLPIAWGDTADPGRGSARYQRDAEASDEGLWLYRLAGDVREDARPHITFPAASDLVGA